MVAAVDMRRKGNLMLAAEKIGGLNGYAAQRFAGGVKYIPLAVDLTGFGHISGHSVSS